MPEGDTVHKGATLMQPGLVGNKLTQLLSRGDQPLFVDPPTIETIRAIGKHLLIQFDNGWTVRVHLGMHGRWLRVEPDWPRRGEIHLQLQTDQELYVLQNAKDVEKFRTSDLIRHPILTQLGPDLLGPEPDWEHIADRAYQRPAVLGELLLDQRVACGLGNVYRNELCFLGPLRGPFWHPNKGTSPRTPLHILTRQELIAIYQRGRLMMLANLGGWPRTTTMDARSGYGPVRGARSWIYGRQGMPCVRCRTTILARGTDAAPIRGDSRLTIWCPTCQPLGHWGKTCTEKPLRIPEQ